MAKKIGQTIGTTLGGLLEDTKIPMAKSAGKILGAVGQGIDLLTAPKAKRPEFIDPQQAELNARLTELNKGYYTGAGYKEGVRQLNNATSAANNALATAFGGNAGSILAGLQLNQAAYGNNYGNLFSNMETQKLNALQRLETNTQSMIDRKAQLEANKYAQDLNDNKQAVQSFLTNTTSGNMGNMFGNDTDNDKEAEAIPDADDGAMIGASSGSTGGLKGLRISPQTGMNSQLNLKPKDVLNAAQFAKLFM